MTRHINSLSDQTLAELKREMQQLRNDTSNLRRHLAHVGARHREAVWVPGSGADWLCYEEGYLVKPAGYTDADDEFPDSGGSAYRAGIAYGETHGTETTVGISHDNSVLYPYVDGNFTATKDGIYVCFLYVRCNYDFSYTTTGYIIAPFDIGIFRKTINPLDGGAGNQARLEWFVLHNSDNPNITPEYTSHTMSYTISLRTGDKMGIRCSGVAGYSTGSYYLRAALSQSTLKITRVSDEYENIWGWYNPDA